MSIEPNAIRDTAGGDTLEVRNSKAFATGEISQDSEHHKSIYLLVISTKPKRPLFYEDLFSGE